jgi:GNAT superfamily N-acetyltransferase
MESMIVRPARLSDAPQIVDFQIRMARETEGLRLERATVSAGVRAVFDDPRKGAYWVAEEEGRLIGSLLTLPEWSDWRNGTVLWIHSLYVVPEARRRGVFSALYAALRRRVEASPALKGLRLYVDKRNTVAQSVYTARGMTSEHYELFEWLKPDG